MTRAEKLKLMRKLARDLLVDYENLNLDESARIMTDILAIIHDAEQLEQSDGRP